MNTKKLLIFLLAVAISVASLFVLSGCGETEPPECTAHNDADDDGICDTEGCGTVVSTTAAFTVNIKDYFGNVPTGSFVLSVNNKDGSTTKIRIKDGTATTILSRDEYTFSIDTEGNYIYDESEAKWSNDRRNVDITLYSPIGNKQTLQVACTDHLDSLDDDCVCDKCGVTLPSSHINNNPAEDCDCDVCGSAYISFHNDADADCVCDICHVDYHPDNNNDCACDNCGAALIRLDDVLEGRRPSDAYAVLAGATRVEVGESDISYFIFTPTKSGIYKFYVVSDGGATLGYYGAPHFVQRENTAIIVNDAFTINISDGAINDGIGGTSQYVLGVKSAVKENAVLVIERLSAPEAELPFTDIRAEAGSAKYSDALNDGLIDIDVRGAVSVVYNENDGFYHYGSANGPLVVVKITTAGNSNLSDLSLASFLTISETDRLCCYFYNSKCELIKKENYNTMIEDYAALCGSRGVVPLDQTLADALKNMGEHKGWWKKSGEGSSYIFGDTTVNTESAWLFACAYLDEDRYGADNAPIVITPEDDVSYSVRLDEGELVSVKINAQSTSSYTLTLNIDENVTVFVGTDMYFGNATGQLTIDVNGGDVIQLTAGETVISGLVFTLK